MFYLFCLAYGRGSFNFWWTSKTRSTLFYMVINLVRDPESSRVRRIRFAYMFMRIGNSFEATPEVSPELLLHRVFFPLILYSTPQIPLGDCSLVFSCSERTTQQRLLFNSVSTFAIAAGARKPNLYKINAA